MNYEGHYLFEFEGILLAQLVKKMIYHKKYSNHIIKKYKHHTNHKFQ